MLTAQKPNWPAKVVTGVSLLLLMLFVYAALSKLLQVKVFVNQVRLSPLIPGGMHELVAIAIPVTEIIIGAALCFRQSRRLALYASYFLMLLFTLYLFFLLNYSTFVPCSCGGILGKMSWNTHIIFNSCFVVLAGVACFLEERLARQQRNDH